MKRMIPSRPSQQRPRQSMSTSRLLAGALAVTCLIGLAACDDEPIPGGGGGGGGGTTSLKACQVGDMGPCGSFRTSEGVTLQLGRYGAMVEQNVGTGFANQAVDGGDLGCGIFGALFAQDAATTARVLDIRGLNLNLYTVYRPANMGSGEKFPVITWGNGTCAKPEGYGALLRFIASHGYIVVAANTRNVGVGSPPPMRKALNFIFAANQDPSSPYFGKVDTNRVGAAGHSQGGMATAAAAGDVRVKSVILYNGGTSANKPFLAISGDRDLMGGVAGYKTGVARAPKAAYLFYHKIPGNGAIDGHLTLMTQPERLADASVQWFNLTLKNDAAAREWFVGPSCKLCNQAANFEFGQKGL